MKNALCLMLMLAGAIWATDVHAAATLTYDYDADGNMIRGEGKYYEYNDANQLVKVRNNDAAGAVIAEYFYDYNGQRIKKVENGVTTYYIGKHYEKQFAGNSQSSTNYFFANGERVAKNESSGRLTYYHSDHLGGTNATTDAAGNLVERTKYYPFGEMREGGSEKYSYTGKEKDKQTDWYYYEARYYNPQIKHFIQADTIVAMPYNPQALNRYSYVLSNPLKFVDPTGHRLIIAGDKGQKRYNEIVNQLKSTKTGTKLLSDFENLYSKKDITINFGSWLQLLSKSSNYNWKEDRIFFSKFLTKTDSTIALAHEMQHALDDFEIESVVTSGDKDKIQQTLDKYGSTIYEKTEANAFVTQDNVYSELKDKGFRPLDARWESIHSNPEEAGRKWGQEQLQKAGN